MEENHTVTKETRTLSAAGLSQASQHGAVPACINDASLM
jgi:hypothetical protein